MLNTLRKVKLYSLISTSVFENHAGPYESNDMMHTLVSDQDSGTATRAAK